jgi:hypothetical protein
MAPRIAAGFITARSAKNAWRRARDCAPDFSSRNVRALAAQALGERQRRGPAHRLQRPCRGDLALHALRDLGGECRQIGRDGRARADRDGARAACEPGDGCCHQIAVEHRVDAAPVQHLGGADRIAGRGEAGGAFGADQPRQALGAAGAGDQAELHLRQAEAGAGGGDAPGAGERQFQPAAEHGAVQRRAPRDRRGLDGGVDIGQVRRHRVAVEFGDIAAGDEGAAGAGDHGGAHAHRRDLVHRVHQAGADRLAGGVDRRVVDAHEGDIALARDADRAAHHTRSMASAMPWPTPMHMVQSARRRRRAAVPAPRSAPAARRTCRADGRARWRRRWGSPGARRRAGRARG